MGKTVRFNTSVSIDSWKPSGIRNDDGVHTIWLIKILITWSNIELSEIGTVLLYDQIRYGLVYKKNHFPTVVDYLHCNLFFTFAWAGIQIMFSEVR